MVVIIPQVVTEDRAAGGLSIDGSLVFNRQGYLNRTPSSAGNRTTWTFSVWVKRTHLAAGGATDDVDPIFCAGTSSSASTDFQFMKDTSDNENRIWWINWDGGSTYFSLETNARYKDTNAWYHMVGSYDGTTAKIYVNGSLIKSTEYADHTQNGGTSKVNSTEVHSIGAFGQGTLGWAGQYMSQFYLIDGQALDATNFGYTDELTNTWKPKKYVNTVASPGDKNGVVGYGTCGCYLPLDGSGPIGKDQSGQGNDWIPKTLCGSTVIPKATGALPILNTTSGGRIIVPSMRGQVGVAVTVYNSKYYLDGDQTPSLDQYRGQTITFDQSDATNIGHPLRFSTTDDGIHTGGGAEYISGVSTAGTAGTSLYYGVDLDGSGDYLKVEQDSSQFSGQGDYTVEAWARFDAFPADNALWSNWNSTGSATRSILLECNSSSGGFRFMINPDGDGGSWIILNSVRPIPVVGQWYHLCQTYDHSATTTKCYIDGVFYGENTSTTVKNDTNADLHIGVNAGGASGYMNGQVTNFRWSNTVRYTSDFTPSRTPFIGDSATVFLGCLSSSATTTAVTNTAGTISATGDPTVFEVFNLYGPYTRMTIPHDAANTLYYYSAHNSSMGGSISLTTDQQVADPYAWKNVLALPLKDNLTDAGIACTSTIKAFTSSGPTGVSSSSVFYGGSYYFDGASTAHMVSGASSDFSFGTKDFTIECWVLWTGSSEEGVFQLSTSSTGYSATNVNTVSLRMDNTWRAYANDASNNFTEKAVTNKWTHLALIRESGTLKLYVDGNQDATTFSDSRDYSMTYCGIGANYSTTYTWHGQIQDFKVYKGIAKYTTNFIPASSTPNIVADSPSGVVYGSDLTKPISSSVAGDGAGDYFLTSVSSDYTLGTDDFTLECWIYPEKSDNGPGVITAGSGADSYSCLLCYSHTSAMGFGCYLSSNGSGWDIAMFADLNTGGYTPGQWQHYALTRDGNTFRIFLDGVLKDTHTSSASLYQNTNQLSILGPRDSSYFQGLVSNLRFIKGTALYTATFTPPTEPLTAITNTKLLCCQSYKSAAAATVSPGALTVSGNAMSSLSNPFDDDISAVIGKGSGYVTLDPLHVFADNCTLSNGNLTATGSAESYPGTAANIALTSGKWYYEFQIDSKASNPMCGVIQNNYLSGGSGRILYRANGNYVLADGSEPTDPVTFSPGDIIGVAIDLDDSLGYIRFYKNGVMQPIIAGLSSIKSALSMSTLGGILPYLQMYTGDVCTVNFGQKPFMFPPLDTINPLHNGFQPLNLANLPSPALVRPGLGVGISTYSGSGSGAQYVSLGFKPDVVWIKSLNNTWYWNCYDSVRGSGKDGTDDAAYYIGCNDTSAQSNVNAVSGTQFQGFYGGDSYGGYIPHYYTGGSGQELNTSGANYVGYGWKAGGGTGAGGEFWKDDVQYGSAAAVGLSGGDYTPKACSINTERGFNILAWDGDLTGAGTKSIPHGMSGLADAGWMIISKRYDGGTSDWWVQHSSVADGSNVLKLNSNAAETDISSDGTLTSPTNTLFYGNWNSGLAGSTNNVGYIWKDLAGIQKFGFYTGNGDSEDGPFVDLGFSPALLMIKSSSHAENWNTFDNVRSLYNEVNCNIILNATTEENCTTTARRLDFLSNGFKIRGDDGTINTNNYIYVYAAWAYQPTNNLYGGQSNAR